MDSKMLKVLRSSLAALALLGTLTFVPAAQAQQWRVSGNGFGTSVRTLTATTQSPTATLHPNGGYATEEAETFDVANAINARWLSAVTSGDSDQSPGAQTVSELENVTVLNGLVRADVVTAIASSYAGTSGVGSDGDGSFVNLVVNGTPITTDVAPNTRVDIPLVGYVVLNEQVRSGDGTNSTGIRLNMIHVHLLNGGEIIVGSASSGVTR